MKLFKILVPALLFSLSGSAHSAPWRFWAFSDIHTYPTEKRYPKGIPPQFRKLVHQLAEELKNKDSNLQRPEFLVITGDSTNGNRKDSFVLQDRAPVWWKNFQESLAPLTRTGIPIYHVPGNHDTYLPAQRLAYEQAWQGMLPDGWSPGASIRNPSSRLLKPVPEIVTDVHLDAAPFSYSFEKNGVLFISAFIPEPGRLDADVRHFLKHELARTNRMKIVFAHSPVVSVIDYDNPRIASFRATLSQLLAPAKISAYICGHEHLFWDETFSFPGGESLHQIIVGTASATYNHWMSVPARKFAKCRQDGKAYTCAMPQTKSRFQADYFAADKRHPRAFQEVNKQVFTEFVVDPEHETVTAVPHAFVNGKIQDFYQ